MAEAPEGADLHHMTPARNRIFVRIQLFDIRSQRRINVNEPHLESDINHVREFLREHGMDLTPLNSQGQPQHWPSNLLTGRDEFISKHSRDTHDLALPIPPAPQEEEMEMSEIDQSSATQKALDVDISDPNPVSPIPLKVPEPGTAVLDNFGKAGKGKRKGRGKGKGRRKGKKTQKNPKPTTSLSQPTKDRAEVPEPLDQSGTGTKDSLEPFATSSQLMAEVERRLALVNGMGASTSTAGTNNKRHKKIVKPVEPPSTSFSSRPKRETKPPSRYQDEDFSQTRRQRKIPPLPAAGSTFWKNTKAKAKAKTVDVLSTSKDHKPILTSGTSATMKPPISQCPKDLKFASGVSSKIIFGKAKTAPATSSAPYSDESSDSETEAKSSNPTMLTKSTMPAGTTTDLPLSTSTIDLKVISSPTQFGTLCENQRVLARMNKTDNFFCPGKIILKVGKKEKWVVSFDALNVIQKILSERYIIPINVLGNGVHAWYRRSDQEKQIVWIQEVLILANCKMDPSSTLMYNFCYSENDKYGFSWADWMKFEVHGTELDKLLGEWEQHKQRIETAAAATRNSGPSMKFVNSGDRDTNGTDEDSTK